MNRILQTNILTFCCVFSLCSCTMTNKKNSNDSMAEKNGTEQTDEVYIQPDIYKTKEGDLKVTLVGHGSLMLEYDGKVLHIDPYSKIADYNKLKKADLILLTHEHQDHLDSAAIASIKKENTLFIVSEACNEILGYGNIIRNGEENIFENIKIKAVPGYNIVNKRPDGEYYHPKGRGNGYVLTFADLNVYVAGDTENIPEMDSLKNTIDIAFLPKNLPYTMNDGMFVDAALKVSPKYLYPYHMNEFDQNKLSALINDDNINMIIKPMSN